MEIDAQMMAHFWEESTGDKVQVSRGFTELKPCNYTATACQTAHHFRETIPAYPPPVAKKARRLPPRPSVAPTDQWLISE
ncbi:MAG: hypothetical protein WBB04_06445 [Candidatus Macondimonas sp.]